MSSKTHQSFQNITKHQFTKTGQYVYMTLLMTCNHKDHNQYSLIKREKVPNQQKKCINLTEVIGITGILTAATSKLSLLSPNYVFLKIIKTNNLLSWRMSSDMMKTVMY
jgi:hypothetical protein